MNGEYIRVWKGVILAYLKVLSQHSPEETDKNHRLALNTAKIQRYLLNTPTCSVLIMPRPFLKNCKGIVCLIPKHFQLMIINYILTLH
jgi:hypothetical protein